MFCSHYYVKALEIISRLSKTSLKHKKKSLLCYATLFCQQTMHIVLLRSFCQQQTLMWRQSFNQFIFFLDDVYVGILADRVPGVLRHDLHEYYDFAYDSFLNRRLKWIYEKYTFYHNPTINDMYSLWGVICGTKGNCKYRSKWLEIHIAISWSITQNLVPFFKQNRFLSFIIYLYLFISY